MGDENKRKLQLQRLHYIKEKTKQIDQVNLEKLKTVRINKNADSKSMQEEQNRE